MSRRQLLSCAHNVSMKSPNVRGRDHEGQHAQCIDHTVALRLPVFVLSVSLQTMLSEITERHLSTHSLQINYEHRTDRVINYPTAILKSW